jgi:hypothetical protein
MEKNTMKKTVAYDGKKKNERKKMEEDPLGNLVFVQKKVDRRRKWTYPENPEDYEQYITKHGYIIRKVADNGRVTDWRWAHYYNWEEAGYEVPPGYVLAFMDGNPQNVEVENLELITKLEQKHRNIERCRLKRREMLFRIIEGNEEEED